MADPDENGRFDPLYVAHLLWRRKSIIFGTFIFALIIGIVVIVRSGPQYGVRMIVGPVEQSIAPAQNDLMGGVAALSGIDLRGPRSNELATFTAMMTSTPVAEEMEKRYHLLRQFLPTAWNDSERRWKRRDEIDLGLRGWIKEKLGILVVGEPSVSTLSTLLGSYLVFLDVDRTPFIQVIYTTPHPEEGIQLLNELYQATNEVYARGRIAVDERQIDYINNTLKSETRADVRQVQIGLLERYENELIMLRSGEPLLARVIQPAIASDTPVWPKPSLILIIAGVIGILAGIVISLIAPRAPQSGGVITILLETAASSLRSRLQREQGKSHSARL
jgi:uncharacterized protein involved in exopolysaccharide biosynthesis